MSKPLRLLIVEDSEDDTLLLLRELLRGGYEPVFERVETPESMKSALEKQKWDLIISDYVLPRFSGLAALTVLKESGLDLPFIIVSGNIGEDIAVGTMKAGAHDYILKGNLKRLIPAVERELREAEVRRERRWAEAALVEQSTTLEAFFSHSLTPLVFLDKDFNYLRVNEAYAKAWQRDVSEFRGRNHFEFSPHEENETIFRRVVETKVPFQAIAKPFLFPDHPEQGVTYWDWTLVPVLDNEGEVDFLVFSLNDVTERKEAEDRIDATNTLLKLFSKSLSRKEYLDSVARQIREWCDCRCAGIRLLDERGYIPYESHTGFSQEFYESENMLSIRKDECACIRVITEKPDPLDARFMTESGSFFSRNIRKFAGEFTEAEKACSRGMCIKSGFSSVAIIPIRHSEKVIGAVHIADEREGKVPLKTVEFVEFMSPLIGEAVYKFSMEEKLERNNEELRNLSLHLQTALEKERASVAREIHDELGQTLTALKFDLSWLIDKYRDHKVVFKKAASLIEIVDATIKTVKRICSQLRPGVLDDLGLTAAIEWQAGEFQKRTGIACDVTFIPEDIVLDRDRSTAIFRIFQETLTNVTRHAEATRVRAIFEEKNGEILVCIEDNGKGIRQRQIQNPRSFGLIGIRERVLSLSGNVEIRGIRDKGTTIKIRIPLGEKGR